MNWRLLAFLSLLSGCASQKPKSFTLNSPADEAWFQSAGNRIKSTWMPLMKREFRAEEKAHSVSEDLNAYTTRVLVTMDANGKVKTWRATRPAKVKAMSRIAEETFRKVDQLPPPPADLMKNGEAKVALDLAVER